MLPQRAMRYQYPKRRAQKTGARAQRYNGVQGTKSQYADRANRAQIRAQRVAELTEHSAQVTRANGCAPQEHRELTGHQSTEPSDARAQSTEQRAEDKKALRTGHRVSPVTHSAHRAESTQHRAKSTRHRAKKHRGTKEHGAQSTGHRARSQIKHQASNIWH
jgi:hypothetical protein